MSLSVECIQLLDCGQYVVWEDQHVHDPAQLPDAGHVPTVSGRGMRDDPLSRPRGLRPLHLRVFRRRTVHQGDGDGLRRARDVPGRHVELSGPVHRRCRVSDSCLAFFTFFCPNALARRRWCLIIAPASRYATELPSQDLFCPVCRIRCTVTLAECHKTHNPLWCCRAIFSRACLFLGYRQRDHIAEYADVCCGPCRCSGRNTVGVISAVLPHCLGRLSTVIRCYLSQEHRHA